MKNAISKVADAMLKSNTVLLSMFFSVLGIFLSYSAITNGVGSEEFIKNSNLAVAGSALITVLAIKFFFEDKRAKAKAE